MRRRGVTLIGLAMVGAGLVWAAIAWADTADFKIQKPSGQYVTVEVDQDAPTYKTYRYDGLTKDGRSLNSVLDEIGFKDNAWTSVTVDGLTVTNGEFPNKKPPIFIVKGDDDLTFYRPKTADGPAETRSGIAVMTFRTRLDVNASDNSPEAGQTVTYTASVYKGGPQSAFEFKWTPSTGTGGTGPKFKYTYPETTGEVTINVNAKRGSDNMTVGTATTSSVKIEAPPPANNGGSGYTPPSSSYNPGYTPPSDYDYNFPDSGGSPTEIPDDPIKTPDPDEVPELEIPGTDVEGELLSATAPLPPSSGDAPAAEEETPPADPEKAIEEAEEISAPGALIAGGIVVGLLGLGAGREMETTRPRRLRRPDLSRLRRLSPPWK